MAESEFMPPDLPLDPGPDEDGRNIGRRGLDGTWRPDSEWEDRFMGDPHPDMDGGWTIDGDPATMRWRSKLRGRDDCVVPQDRDYVPFESLFDTDSRYAYHPGDVEFPRWSDHRQNYPETDPNRNQRLEAYQRNRVDRERFPPGHVFEFAGWRGDLDDELESVDDMRTRMDLEEGSRSGRLGPSLADDVMGRGPGGRPHDRLDMLDDDILDDEPPEIFDQIAAGGRADDSLELWDERWAKGRDFSPLRELPGDDFDFLDDNEDDFEDDPFGLLGGGGGRGGRGFGGYDGFEY